jgi:hypothetical protein
MKQKIPLACCQFFITSVTSYLPSIYKILTVESRREHCKKFDSINRMGWELQLDVHLSLIVPPLSLSLSLSVGWITSVDLPKTDSG